MGRKSDLNLSLGVDVKKGFDEAVLEINSQGKKLEQAAKRMTDAIGKNYGQAFGELKKNFKETSSILKEQRSITKELEADLRQLNQSLKTASGSDKGRIEKEIDHVNEALKEQRSVISNLTGQAAAYREGMKAATSRVGWMEVGNAIEGVARGFQVAQGAAALLGDENEDVMKAMQKMQAVMVFTEGIRGLKHLQTSFQALGLIIKANPIIAAATAIAAVSVAAYKLSQALDTEYQAQKRLNEINDKALDNIQKEVVGLDNLVKIAKNENVARDLRQKAVDKLQKEYPSYLKNINLENINSQETAAAIRSVTSALLNKAKATVVEEELVEALKEQRKLQKEISEGKSVGGFFKFLGRGFVQAEDAIESSRQEVKLLQSELAKLTVKGGIDFDIKEPKKTKTTTTSAFDLRLQALEKAQTIERNKVKEQLLNNELSEYKAKQALAEIDIVFANKRLEINKKFGKDVEKQTETTLDNQISYLKEFVQEIDGLNPTITPEIDLVNLEVDFSKTNNLVSEGIRASLAESQKFNDQFNQIILSSQESLITTMAQNMGEAMATNKDIGQAMGNTLMIGIADFLSNMGKMMISAGIAKELFDKAMVTFGGGAGAVAAGFGLVLAGTALKTAMSQSIAPVPLAEGGVMRGTTFGMLAEYPTANIDPEVAIRSSYLKGMINDAVGNVGGQSNVKFRIEGRDLVAILDRGKKDKNRA